MRISSLSPVLVFFGAQFCLFSLHYPKVHPLESGYEKVVEFKATSGAKYFLKIFLYEKSIPRMRTWVALDLPRRMGKVKVEQPKNNYIFIPALQYTLYLKVLSSTMDPADIRLNR